MPTVNDNFRITIVQELAGLQLSNTMYGRIDDLGDLPSIADVIEDTLTIYYDTVKDIASDAWAIVCGIYENLSQVEEKTLRFLTLPGLSLTDSHPSDQVVRMNQYAVDVTPLPAVRRGAWNQAGIIESLSTAGRINNAGSFTNLRGFLDTQFVLPGPGWTITPVLRYQPVPSVPIVSHAFEPMALGQVSSRLFKLASRKTALCRLF